ncbi:MAG TPA: RNA 2',3'-cyclic phosphodiesterase [Anaerolineae bacterium]
MTDTIRSFIAIELEEEHRRALSDLQARFQRDRAASFVRWVAAESIHLTLKFLGDVDATAMPALQRTVADACAGIAPFTLSLNGAGAFPNTRRPNVIWVGMGGQVECTALLAQRLDDACAAMGMARDDRPFSPHLTLGRVKREAKLEERQLVGRLIDLAAVGELGWLNVSRVSMMKSELRRSGSIYTRLAAVELLRE